MSASDSPCAVEGCRYDDGDSCGLDLLGINTSRALALFDAGHPVARGCRISIAATEFADLFASPVPTLERQTNDDDA